MTTLLLDPPVGPYSPLPELRAWRAELAKLQTKYLEDPRALRVVVDAIDEVEDWLLAAEGRA